MATVNYTVFDGEIVEEDRGGTVRGYVPDPLGSTRALLNSSQTITDSWSYWPYGEVQTSEATTPTPFTFVGTHGYHKDATGLTYVRARFYRPSVGQWVTTDAAYPSGLAYVYANSLPVVFIDPSGNQVRVLDVDGGPIPPLPGTTTTTTGSTFLGGRKCNRDNYDWPGGMTNREEKDGNAYIVGRTSCGSISISVSTSGTFTLNGKVFSVGLSSTWGQTHTCSCENEVYKRQHTVYDYVCKCITYCRETYCSWDVTITHSYKRRRRKVLSCPWPGGDYVIEDVSY
jgi:RHS repeat-associated protein